MAKHWKLQARQSGKDKLWYVNLSGGNGETIMRSKGFRSEGEASDLAAGVERAKIEVMPETGVVDSWHVAPHKSPKDSLWYNRLIRQDGAIMMWSEGYARVDSAQRACLKMRDAMVVTLPPVGLK